MLEYGEHNGNVYGTHLDSIRSVIQQGKMCVLDCAPNSLKMLHQSQEFLPYVVFIAAPGMEQLKQIYAERRATGGSQRNLAVSEKDIQCQICSKYYYVASVLNDRSLSFYNFSLIVNRRSGTVRGGLALWNRWPRCTRTTTWSRRWRRVPYCSASTRTTLTW